ncbi:acyl-CoA carboxylase epsilon subunit [Amycolatopsis sp. NPDC051071]|uniref:acyl-CoA carboxylase epsilon subunit n=1 Tax=Amycolatopsis sp. NPDC051071 TaxID=3154637 RepID=UPI003441E909
MPPSEKDTGVPVFRVLRGDPEDAALAALVAVFGALAAAVPPPAAPVPSAWSPQTRPAWRTSTLP